MKPTEKAPAAKGVSREALREHFGPRLEFDKPMAPFTSFRTGGPATLFLRVESADQLAGAICTARRLGVFFFLLGGGSNLLVADAGYDGLVIKLDIRGLRVVEEATIESGAGENLMDLVEFARDNGLAGLEFAAGIWGTVGGAVYGNAGAFGGEIGDIIADLTLVDSDGNITTVGPDHCCFAYRDSALKRTGEVVVLVRFKLQPGEPTRIKERIDEILALRVAKHPDQLTAGCFFKNIPDPKEPHGKLPAGRLLEEAGVKGLSVGGARVFDKHANIIVNTGTATSGDIRRLADLMKEKVRTRFGIELQEEVIHLGEF